MKYTVISTPKTISPKDDLKRLTLEVSQKLNEGWSLVGGIAVDTYGLYQAMVTTQ